MFIQGLVKWARNIRVKTSCEMDIVNFPYDSQTCPITISSQDNSNEFLKLSTRKWNRLNGVNENQTDVSPSAINTIKVSYNLYKNNCCTVYSFLFRIIIIPNQMLGYSRVIHTK